jgi:hypothetical protein
MTTNAREWADYFGKEESEVSDIDVYAVALSRTRDEIMDILMNHLEKAIESTEEFVRKPLKDKLLQVFYDYDIIQIAGGSLTFNAKQVAGDWGDFWDGVNAARAAIAGKKTLSPQQRAAFWRMFVWPSYSAGSAFEFDPENADYDEEEEDLWSMTINLRQAAWGHKAPYWLILEMGNDEQDYAHPQNKPTNFLYNATIEAQKVFNYAVADVEVEATNLIEDAADRFIRDPELYDAYDVLESFWAEGRQYYVYITSTKRIGVALSESYYGLQRQYG